MRFPGCVLAIGWAASLAGAAPLSAAAAPEAPELSVYAAASLREALQELAPACERALGVRLVFNLGASSDLARQIEAAGKADVFFSADEAWMDAVAGAGLVDEASRRSPLSNRLVVVGRADRPPDLRVPADLAGPAIRRISLANPDAVPAGKYAKAWLVKAGLWEAVRDRVVPGLDVRAALAAVESGAVEVGIVYRTDAALSRAARVLYEVPEGQGPAISYAVAALRGRPRPDLARRAAAWLAGPEAAPVFVRLGFILRDRPP